MENNLLSVCSVQTFRIEYPGAWYHVMNRGRRKEDIFPDRHDYEAFITVLQEASDTWNLGVSAYCLMFNHYHLLVQTPESNIPRCMRHVKQLTQRQLADLLDVSYS
jgi:REP element-mobilizing transposase RayT